MLSALVRHWWLLGIRGALALLFGLVALAWRGVGLGELVLLFGAYALLDGLGAIATAVRAVDRPRQGWPLLAEGAVSVAIGLTAWLSPVIPRGLLYLVASWGIVTGVLEIAGARGLRSEPVGQWMLGLGGASSVLLGILLMALPGAGDAAVVRLIGAYALAFGALVLLAALRLRGRG